MKQLQRIDQILSRYGYSSRSEARHWVRAKRVLVSGAVADSVQERVNPADVLIDGEPIECPNGILAVMHKPLDCVCSHDEREGTRVYDLLPPRWLERNPPVTTVGRLDKDTSGVLLITDLGTLVHSYASPRHKVAKIYEVTVDRKLDPSLVEKFAAGTLQLSGENRPCEPAQLEIVGSLEARLELKQGMYHQVRRMFGAYGFTVQRLHRSRFGRFEVHDIPVGQWRIVPPTEPEPA